MLPKAVRDLSQELQRLPGIGPKTAQRLSIYLLRQPRGVVSKFADTLKNLHANVRICSQCFNLAEKNTCDVCLSDMRTSRILCVVEDPLDIEAIERTNTYEGRY
ncbi:MAG: recombination protein RecR, partial [Candidatus Andersenbacteria bacterium]